MPKRPSFQFYPGDWRRDAALQSCTVGARGLLIEMMTFMHEGTPYGHLKVNHKVILAPNLARMVGATFDEVEGWLSELEEAGVLDRDEDGAYVSRRMVRDEDLRQRRAAGGSKGGNPALMKAGKKSGKVNLRPNLEITSSSSSSSSSPSSSSEKNPPSPQGVTKPSRPKGRKIPAVRIPEELRLIGIDHEAFAERVRTCGTTKKPETWQKELDRLAPLVAECGGAVVLETWEDAIASGWQGCTPEFVRRKANGKGSPDKPRGRFSQPHTIAPGSSGKDHGIDY